jgi:transcriptional regulator with XRE-family HTH domain
MDPRTALRGYIADIDISAAEFARRIGYDRSNLHRLLNEHDAWPSLELARKIERETTGRVPMALWADAKTASESKAAA